MKAAEEIEKKAQAGAQAAGGIRLPLPVDLVLPTDLAGAETFA